MSASKLKTYLKHNTIEEEDFLDMRDDLDVLYPGKEEMTETKVLDLIFGPIPPASLIKPNMMFKKPSMPNKKYKPEKLLPQVDKQMFCSDVLEQESEESQQEETEKEKDETEERRKHFLRIGGMLILPVPAKGPLFSPEEET